MWRELCAGFFDRYISPDNTVVDLAAGACEFINAVRARTRIAVDINPAVCDMATAGVTALVSPADDLAEVGDGRSTSCSRATSSSTSTGRRSWR